MEKDMNRVSRREFWAWLDRWRLVASKSHIMPMENTGGKYTQTGYFSVLEIVGTMLVPDESNLVAVCRRAPTMSHGNDMAYFINLNARPRCLC